jgi:hypothetical protein
VCVVLGVGEGPGVVGDAVVEVQDLILRFFIYMKNLKGLFIYGKKSL